MAVTLKDIARDAHVGVCTASYVINGTGLHKVSEATRQQVLASAKKLGYQPNMAAKWLKTGRTYMIGILLQEVSGSFYPEILQGIENVLQRQGYSMLLATFWDEQSLEEKCDYLYQRHVDGVIVFPDHIMDSREKLGSLKDLPMVSVTGQLDGVESALVDPVQIGKIAAQKLKACGHEFIAYAGPEGTKRLEGILTQYDTEACQVYGEVTNYDFVKGGKIFSWLQGLMPKVTAVICESDLTAVSVIRHAMVQGMKLPQDLSVIGIDGLSIGEICFPALTSVGQPTFKQGSAAADMILTLIAKKKCQGRLLKPFLIERESCWDFRSR